MILGFTGHRPDRLGSEYDLNGPYSNYLKDEVTKLVRELRPEKLISGMALGFDMLVALIGINEGIKVIAAIPCDNQDRFWPPESKTLYHNILNDSLVEKVVVCQGPYASWKMQKRNVYIVDSSDRMIAAWDGTPGGTGNCVKYAKLAKKPITIIDPEGWKHA